MSKVKDTGLLQRSSFLVNRVPFDVGRGSELRKGASHRRSFKGEWALAVHRQDSREQEAWSSRGQPKQESSDSALKGRKKISIECFSPDRSFR